MLIMQIKWIIHLDKKEIRNLINNNSNNKNYLRNKDYSNLKYFQIKIIYRNNKILISRNYLMKKLI